MKHFNKEVEALMDEFEASSVSLEYRERNCFTADATITIKTNGMTESIDVMFINNDGKYFASSSSFYSSRDSISLDLNNLDELLDLLRKRIKLSLSITGTKTKEIDKELIKKVAEKYGIEIINSYGTTYIEHKSLRVICNVEREVALIPIGFKTTEVPLGDSIDLLERFSQYPTLN